MLVPPSLGTQGIQTQLGQETMCTLLGVVSCAFTPVPSRYIASARPRLAKESIPDPLLSEDKVPKWKKS